MTKHNYVLGGVPRVKGRFMVDSKDGPVSLRKG